MSNNDMSSYYSRTLQNLRSHLESHAVPYKTL